MLHVQLGGEEGVLRDESWLDLTIVNRPRHVVNHDLMKEELIRMLSPVYRQLWEYVFFGPWCFFIRI